MYGKYLSYNLSESLSYTINNYSDFLIKLQYYNFLQRAIEYCVSIFFRIFGRENCH